MDSPVGAIPRDIALHDDIIRIAQAGKNNVEKVGGKTESLRRKIEKQLETLWDKSANYMVAKELREVEPS